jgi:putative inorganic carbon (hco3(-)) transporter
MVKRTLAFLDRFHWLWLLLASPFMLFPSPQRSLAMLVVPGLFLLRWAVIGGKKNAFHLRSQESEAQPKGLISITPMNGALLLMAIMVLVSLWATFDINFSLPKVSGMVLGLGIFFAIAREGQTRAGWWWSFILLLAVGFGISVVGLLGTHWVTKVTLLRPIVTKLSPRLTGLPGVEEGFNQNSVAGALLWVIPSFCSITWFLIRRVRDLGVHFGKRKTLMIAGLIFGVTAWTIAILMLTQSREAFLGLALTLGIITLIISPRNRRKYVFLGIAILVIVSGAYLATHFQEVSSYFTGSDSAAGSVLSLDSFRARLDVWTRAIMGIRDFPLTGMGMNTFRKVVLALYPFFSVSADIGHAHNEFLQAGLDLGIPGLIAFTAMYILAFWMLARSWRIIHDARPNNAKVQNDPFPASRRKNWLTILPLLFLNDPQLIKLEILGLGGGLLAHFIWGMMDAMSLGSRPGFVFWILLGLITGLYIQIDCRIANPGGSIAGRTEDESTK